MTTYIVTFFKKGIEEARRRFASMRKITDWQYHADTVEIAMAPINGLPVTGHRKESKEEG